MEYGAVREMQWDCQVCGHKGILGRHEQCSQCGASQPANVHFYPIENAPEVTDSSLIKEANAGADKVCPYCGGSYDGLHSSCPLCGASLTEAVDVNSQPSKTRRAEATQTGSEYANYTPQREIPWGIVGIVVGSLMALILVVFLISQAVRTDDYPANVSGFSWSQSVQTEYLVTHTGSAWEGEVPAGVRIISSSRQLYAQPTKVVGSQKKASGSEPNPNGKPYVCGIATKNNGFSADKLCQPTQIAYINVPVTALADPIYKLKYQYEYDTWDAGRTVSESHAGRETFWPIVTFAYNERERSRSGTYTVQFHLKKGGDKQWSTNSQAEWEKYQNGQQVTLVINKFGAVVGIK